MRARSCARLAVGGSHLRSRARLAFRVFPDCGGRPTFHRPYLDALWNVQHASAIANGRLVGSEPFYRAPLYTYFLAGLLFLTGGNLPWVHVAQIVLGSLTAVLVGTLGARLMGRWVGVLAGFLYAGTATVLLFDFELLNAVVFLPLVVTMLLVLERATREPSPRRFFMTGLALGLAAVARPDILAFFPVALVIAGGVAWRAGWRPGRLLTGGWVAVRRAGGRARPGDHAQRDRRPGLGPHLVPRRRHLLCLQQPARRRLHIGDAGADRHRQLRSRRHLHRQHRVIEPLPGAPRPRARAEAVRGLAVLDGSRLRVDRDGAADVGRSRIAQGVLPHGWVRDR